MNPQAANRGRWFKPWVGALICGALAARWWPQGQRGDDGMCALSTLLWIVCARWFFIGFAGWDFASETRRLRRLSREPTRSAGEAKWGTLQDAKAAGMLEGEGIPLGRLEGQKLWNPGSAHSLTIASSGMGKGIFSTMPILLTHRGSIAAIDLKGDLAACTAAQRRRLGNDVVVINPYREKMRRELGIDLGDTCFNPLSLLKLGRDDLKDEADTLSTLLIPGQPEMSESESYFVGGGQKLLAGVMMHLVSEANGADITLRDLRRALLVPEEQLVDLLTTMATSEAPDGLGEAIAECGGQLAAILSTSPKQFAGLLGKATDALSIYGFGPLGEHVSKNEFDFACMKRKPTTVYIVLPSDRQEKLPWLNLVMSVAMEVVARERTTKAVQFIFEEFANCGYLPGLLRTLSLSRSAGCRVHMYLQQISQVERIYKGGWKEIVGLAEAIQIFGVWEPATLKFVSEWVGQETIRDVSYISQAGEQFSGQQDLSVNSSNRGRALIRPEEVRTLPRNRAILFFKNHRPLKIELVSYLEDRTLCALAAPNPYHRSSEDVAG